MQVLLTIINIVLILNAILLIVCVLMQEGNRAGLGAIGGGAETFFGKSKGKGLEAKLLLITKIGAGVFIVLAIAATAMTASLQTKPAVPAEVPSIEELTAQPEGDTTTEPAAEPATETEPAAEPAAEPATETEPAAEPAAEPTAEPATEPAAEPTAEPATAPATEPAADAPPAA